MSLEAWTEEKMEMTFSKVVIGVDFSGFSPDAMRWVAEAFAPGCELVLVHALDLGDPASFLRSRLPSLKDQVVLEGRDAEVRLRELAASLGLPRVTTEVRAGKPAQILARIAREQSADLIVVGERGIPRGALGGGSMAENLLHIARVPVLHLREMPRERPAHLLVPIDESAVADRVIALAAKLAASTGARVVIVHVLSPGLVGRVSLISTELAAEAMEAALIDDTRKWIGARASAAGLPPGSFDAHVTFGAPAHEILATVDQLENPMVVMGSRGAGAVGRILVGSVARTCARSVGCPILIVPVHDQD